MRLNLFDPKVEDATREYTNKHGGEFFYEEPSAFVIYENEEGEYFSFDNDITDETFVSLLKSDSLRLSPCPPYEEGVDY